MCDEIISILVPIYNIEEYLSQCIESLISQTYSNIEIILIDDGSTDSSGQICDDYVKKDNRIKVVHQENKGLVSARKSAISHANGKFVLNVDGDDWIENDMIEKLYQILCNSGADIVQSGYTEYGGKGKQYTYICDGIEVSSHNNVEILKSWIQGRPSLDNQIFTKLIRRELFESVYSRVPDDMNYGEDWIFFLNILQREFKVVTLDKSYYHYRIRDNSLSHMINKDMARLLKEERLTDYMGDFIEKNFHCLENETVGKWFVNRKIWSLKLLEEKYGSVVVRHSFDNVDILLNKKIAIYGAGSVGRDYIVQLSRYEDIDIVAWVDRDAYKYDYPYRKVHRVEMIQECDLDYIIVAILDVTIKNQVVDTLVKQYGIEKSKILYNC